MSNIIDIADLDCVFLSYDEPQKEEFWVKVKNMVPWAVRVDGVEGSDAAHKAAADASNTERFVLIDGDNLPDPEFFNLQLELKTPEYEKATFRWRARNHVNGLMYGNGGLSCWTKEFIHNMQTHEASDGSADTCVEFCFDPLYWPMHDCYSTTYPNGGAFHAWRAGFREGVKMTLDRGRKPSDLEFKESVHKRNMDHLTIWHNVGMDVDYGIFAILGARMGTLRTMLTDWNYTEVQWFDNLKRIWVEEVITLAESKLPAFVSSLGEELSNRLDLPMMYMDAAQSSFFKHHYMSGWHNMGADVREIDVIRGQEGW
jgi:hypothetical protein